MKALSGLTPALSRRLQRQLLAHLPPAAARSLRRTLSLHAAPPRADPAPDPGVDPAPAADPSYARSLSAGPAVDPAEPAAPAAPPTPAAPDTPPADVEETLASQYCTLPRIRRRSTPRDATPPTSPGAGAGAENPAAAGTRAADRPLLSKYLTPERNLSLDDSYSSDGGSILSDPSYIAAYGPGAAGLGLRRHSLRLTGDQPRKRISRFLRSDFFDSPADESLYAKHKKEKELETQKILREIREKKSRALDATARSPTDTADASGLAREEPGFPRKSVSPIGLLVGKDRSRSNTPFFPILDNIKETAMDNSLVADSKVGSSLNDTKQKQRIDENAKDSRLIRPRSYPVKTLDSIDEPSENVGSENSSGMENDNKDRTLQRESKLIRPKSYPASSPSPEKVYVNRNISRKDETKPVTKEEITGPEIKSDVEVSFSITLPRKPKPEVLTKQNSLKSSDIIEQSIESKVDRDKQSESLVLKKYKVIDEGKSESSETNGKSIANGITSDTKESINNNEAFHKTASSSKKEIVKSKSNESDSNEKKGTIKKKIIKKVSSKSKTDLGSSQDAIDAKGLTDKKKVTRKVKDKTAEDGTKTTVTKKKSVLQSIGHKLEKFASSKSSSPEKVSENNSLNDAKKENSKQSRTQREHSVPINVGPPTESNLIKRAVTLTDVAALDSPIVNQNKTTVSKVLGLFKKFEPKDKTKPVVEKSLSENLEENRETRCKSVSTTESILENGDKDKPRRPTSLLLNGLGRKNKYGRTSSDSVPALSTENDDETILKKDTEPKNIRNSLKLDFSRLPRVKKIVPTNPVIEPQIMNVSSIDNETEKKNLSEKRVPLLDSNINAENADTLSRSRSRSRSTISNSEIKSDLGGDTKLLDKNPVSPSENSTHHPFRNHESTTPEKEDVGDRIRRKSFYSRFNEKKQRRKSSLVGPGATEYDPVARIHSQPIETKFDISPSSPGNYDLSPGISISSDLSPSTERYTSLLAELPSTRNNLRFDHYGLNDKIDTYRSLDRNDFRKYPNSRSYVDYDQPTSYGTHRYSRTKSLLDGPDGTEDNSIIHSIRDPLKYNRTISMYTPGNYATYRPKRTRNSAIILKESEKEPSPENILDKIKQRKNFSISVTRKPDPEKDPLPRSTVPSKGESDGTECSEKVD